MASRGLTTQGRVFLTATLLLLFGLVLDLGGNQPRLREIDRLRGQRSSLLSQLETIQQQELAVATAAQQLGIREQERGFVFHASDDPVAFINGMVAGARLSTVELATEAGAAQGSTRKTTFTLVVSGAFDRMLDLVRALEQSPRLVIIESITVMQPYDGSSLEGRLKLSVYDPVETRER